MTNKKLSWSSAHKWCSTPNSSKSTERMSKYYAVVKLCWFWSLWAAALLSITHNKDMDVNSTPPSMHKSFNQSWNHRSHLGTRSKPLIQAAGPPCAMWGRSSRKEETHWMATKSTSRLSACNPSTCNNLSLPIPGTRNSGLVEQLE